MNNNIINQKTTSAPADPSAKEQLITIYEKTDANNKPVAAPATSSGKENLKSLYEKIPYDSQKDASASADSSGKENLQVLYTYLSPNSSEYDYPDALSGVDNKQLGGQENTCIDMSNTEAQCFNNGNPDPNFDMAYMASKQLYAQGTQIIQNVPNSSRYQTSTKHFDNPAGTATTDKPRAALSAQEFVKMYHCRLYHGGIYIFTNSYYKLFQKSDLRQLLNSHYNKEAATLDSTDFYNRIIEFIKCDSNLVVKDSGIDEIRYKIAFANGYYDILANQFFRPNPNLFFRASLNLPIPSYKFEESCTPIFDTFINSITGGDALLQQRILEMIGLCLSNDMSAKVFFVLQGVGNSGKSTLIDLIASFFDSDLCSSLDIDDFGQKFAVSNLFGKALNICAELGSEPISPRCAKQLKKLTGNDLVDSDQKYQGRIKFKATVKLVFATNHAFLTKERDEALMARIVVIPFKYSISRETANRNLLSALKLERPGICLKAIRAYCNLVQNKYCFSGNFPINEIFHDNCPAVAQIQPDKLTILNDFLTCCVENNPDSCVAVSALYDEYMYWLRKTSSLVSPYASIKLFSSDLKEVLGQNSFQKKRLYPGKNPVSCINGIKLLTPENQ